MVSSLPHDIRQVILKNRTSFHWGLLGPDPLFFHRVYFGGSAVTQFGLRMHSEKTADIFDAMLARIATSFGKEKEILSAYTFGFAGHYALDAAMHPYVYWEEQCRRNCVPSKYWLSLHGVIECHIDELLYPRMTGLPINHFLPSAYFSLTPFMMDTIGDLYQKLIQSVFGGEVKSKHIVQAFHTCSFATVLLYGKVGKISVPVLRPIESVLQVPCALTGHIKGRLQDGDNDVLNLHHRQWRNADFPDQEHYESVPDLIDQALKHGQKLCGRIWDKLIGTARERISFPVAFDNGNFRRKVKP